MAEMGEIVSYNRVGFSGRNNHKISIPGTTLPGSGFHKISIPYPTSLNLFPYLLFQVEI